LFTTELQKRSLSSASVSKTPSKQGPGLTAASPAEGSMIPLTNDPLTVFKLGKSGEVDNLTKSRVEGRKESTESIP
jgi:hypothetical protein